jgi:hypothetical protein
MLFHTIVLCPGLRILKKLKKNLQVPYGAVKTFFVREPCRALYKLLWNALAKRTTDISRQSDFR